MSEERLKLEGRLEVERRRANGIRLQMSGLVQSLIGLLDKYSPLEFLDTPIIAQQAVVLAALQVDYRDSLELMAAMKRDLGQ